MTAVTSNGKPVAGWLGCGIMGSAMAMRLLKSGLYSQVLVFNRTAAKVRALLAVRHGLRCAAPLNWTARERGARARATPTIPKPSSRLWLLARSKFDGPRPREAAQPAPLGNPSRQLSLCHSRRAERAPPSSPAAPLTQTPHSRNKQHEKNQQVRRPRRRRRRAVRVARRGRRRGHGPPDVKGGRRGGRDRSRRRRGGRHGRRGSVGLGGGVGGARRCDGARGAVAAEEAGKEAPGGGGRRRRRR